MTHHRLSVRDMSVIDCHLPHLYKYLWHHYFKTRNIVTLLSPVYLCCLPVVTIPLRNGTCIGHVWRVFQGRAMRRLKWLKTEYKQAGSYNWETWRICSIVWACAVRSYGTSYITVCAAWYVQPNFFKFVVWRTVLIFSLLFQFGVYLF